MLRRGEPAESPMLSFSRTRVRQTGEEAPSGARQTKTISGGVCWLRRVVFAKRRAQTRRSLLTADVWRRPSTISGSKTKFDLAPPPTLPNREGEGP